MSKLVLNDPTYATFGNYDIVATLNGFNLKHRYSGKVENFSNHNDLFSNLTEKAIKENFAIEERTRKIFFNADPDEWTLFSKTKDATFDLEAGIIKLTNGNYEAYDSFIDPKEFKTFEQAVSYLVNNSRTLKLFNPSQDELDRLSTKLESEFSCQINRKGVVMSKTDVVGTTSTDTFFQKVKNNETVNVVTSSVDKSIRMAGARQGSRLITSLMTTLLKSLMEKTNISEYSHLLDTDIAQEMMNVFAPLILHAAFDHGLIPESKYNEHLQAVTRWAVEANITFATLKYGDQVGDLMGSIIADPETRANLVSLVKLGAAMTKAEAGDVADLNRLSNPMSNLDIDLEEAAEVKQKAYEKV